jgi:hypothetical protein
MFLFSKCFLEKIRKKIFGSEKGQSRRFYRDFCVVWRGSAVVSGKFTGLLEEDDPPVAVVFGVDADVDFVLWIIPCSRIWEYGETQRRRNIMEQDQKRGCLVLVVLILAGSVWLGSCIYRAGDEAEKVPIEKRDSHIEALVFMQEYVKGLLKAPSTAKFPGSTDKNTQVLKDGADYIVMSWVDSENSFGAMLRSSYIGVVRQNGAYDWEVISFQFLE